MNILSYSYIGSRLSNQDTYLHRSLGRGEVLLVADGVGGGRAGSLASSIACEAFLRGYEETDDISCSIKLAHKEILEASAEDEAFKGMASTLVACCIKQSTIVGANVGDSRLYLIRGDGLKQLTKDHSEVMKLLDAGELTAKQARLYPRKNVLYSALGTSKPLEMHEFSASLKKGDRLLLLTDGVKDVLSKMEIRDISLVCDNIESFTEELKCDILRRNPSDNCTFLITEIE